MKITRASDRRAGALGVTSASVARPAFFAPNIDGESAQTVAAFARPCADRSYQLFGQEMST